MRVSRRRTVRVRQALSGTWRLGAVAGHALVLNVSAEGALVAVDGELERGERVHLRVDLDGAIVEGVFEVRFIGETRHGPGCGLALVTMPAADRERWLSYYEALAQHAIAAAPPVTARYLRARTRPPRAA